jgi:hypothetical protein
VPTAVGVKVPELALDVVPVPVRGTDVGSTTVPDGHSAGPGNGPQTVKAAVPVGAPPVELPLTVTESVAVPLGPITIEVVEAVVALDEVAGVTAKHSEPVCWETSV